MFKSLTLKKWTSFSYKKEGCENMFASVLSLVPVTLQTMSDVVGEEDEFKP